MKKTLRFLCMIGMLLLLFTACDGFFPANDTPTPVNSGETSDVSEDVAEVVEIVTTPAATPEPIPQTPEETTAEPTQAPQSDRAQKEGDIAINFPDYDTGVDADYSYQSDELRIAITVHREKLPDNKNRQLNEVYYVADIWMRNLNSFRTAFPNGRFASGSAEGDTLARRENAILAVNGSYNQGLVLQAGQVLNNMRANKGWNSGAVGLIYRDGSLKTFYLSKEKLDLNQEIEKGALYGWQFGPIIIRNYEEGPGVTSYHGLGFKARNILGYYEPGHYVIVTCDNRGNDAQGMNEYMMVDLMKSLGVREAFNLDGGTSAVMVFMGEVINHPTLRNDNGTTVEGRPIVDMLLFGEYDENGNSPDLSTLTAAKNGD